MKIYLKVLIKFCQKKPPDINGIFNYFIKMEKLEMLCWIIHQKEIMNVVNKERKIVNKMFNDMYSFYVAESNIYDIMPSPPGSQISSRILRTLHSYDETDLYKSNKLKDLETEMAACKSIALEQFFIIKQTVRLNCEHSLKKR